MDPAELQKKIAEVFAGAAQKLSDIRIGRIRRVEEYVKKNDAKKIEDLKKRLNI